MGRGRSYVKSRAGLVIASILSAVCFCGCAGVEQKATAEESMFHETTASSHPVPQLTSGAPVETSATIRPASTTTSSTSLPDIKEGQRTRNTSECRLIKDPALADVCIRAYANAYAEPSACESVRGPEERDGCYYDLAVKTKDPALCDRIEGKNPGIMCRAAYASDIMSCREITDADIQCDCYNGIILRTGNASLCEGVNPQACRSRCFYGYAVEYDLPEVCGNTDKSTMDACYQDVARRNLDGGGRVRTSARRQGTCAIWTWLQASGTHLSAKR